MRVFCNGSGEDAEEEKIDEALFFAGVERLGRQVGGAEGAGEGGGGGEGGDAANWGAGWEGVGGGVEGEVWSGAWREVTWGADRGAGSEVGVVGAGGCV